MKSIVKKISSHEWPCDFCGNNTNVFISFNMKHIKRTKAFCVCGECRESLVNEFMTVCESHTLQEVVK